MPPPVSSCPTQYEQPFKQFADPLNYALVPGASFEGAVWGGTALAENEPWRVRSGGKRDRTSMRLATGESATSPSICIALVDPHLRFFAKGALPTGLRVDVNFEGPAGAQTLTLPPAVPAATRDGWMLTLPAPVFANVVAQDVAAHEAGSDGFGNPLGDVTFTFTSTAGTWLIDDVYLDPYRRT